MLGFLASSCTQNREGNSFSDRNTPQNNVVEEEALFMDYGPQPAVLNIETYTLENNDFRRALWTGNNLQVTLMSIPAGGEVGLEQHFGLDQFLRIEEGRAKVLMGDNKESLDFEQLADADFVILVPAGKWHNIINVGDTPLKLYSIYAPVEHPHGTIHKTQAEAMEAEHHH